MVATASSLEARFRAAQDALPAHARVARAAAMFAWARDAIRREIRGRDSAMSEERLKWEAALRLYGADATARGLIQRMIDHVSGARRIGCLTHARNLQGEHDCRYNRPQTRGSPGGMSHLHAFSLLLFVVS